MDPDFYDLLTASYQRLLGTALVPPGCDASWLYYEAPFAVLAHNMDPDPRFIYANKAAQACFEYSWDELIGMPSRLSAAAPEREARQHLLEAVARQGYSCGYRGMRIAKSGRRFWIDAGVIWQLVDAQGIPRGQAATFPSPPDGGSARK
jgi:PAS domain S-box-containing protein